MAEPEHGLGTKLEAGASLRGLFGLPVYGPDLGLGLGRVRVDRAPPSGAAEPFFAMRYAYGITPHGLATHTVRLDADVDFVFDRVRLAVGGGFLWFAIERASETGIVQHWGIDLRFGASLDLVRLSDTTATAIYLGSRLGVDVFPHQLVVPRTFSPVGTLDAGLRF
jgi:hypothetical protein